MIRSSDFKEKLKPLEEIAQACCSLYRHRPRLAILGIPWLHFTNSREAAHKDLLKKTDRNILGEIFVRNLWIIGRGFYLSSILIIFSTVGRKERKRLMSQVFEIIGKTWCFADRQEPKEKDFYLGDLPQKLQQKQFPFLLLCGNVLQKRWIPFAKHQTSLKPVCKLPDFYLLSLWNIWAMVFLQMITSIELYCLGWFEKNEIKRRVQFRASVDCLRFQTTLNGLHYWIGKNAVRLFRPKAFLTLYEGHSWEKCLWRGIKKADKNIKILGYQHTVIMGHAFSLRQSARLAFDSLIPDVALCSGHKTAKVLDRNDHKTNFIPFGSFRCPSNPKLESPAPAKHCVVVIPEGVLEEAVLLFNTALKTAQLLPDHHFIFRSHPILPFYKVKPHLEIDPDALKNIEISAREKIDDDFERASVILYRGSSAVLYAILGGLKPFYFDAPGSDFIDPLFDLEIFKDVASEEFELKEKILAYSQIPDEKTAKDWQEACLYIQDYTIPVDDQSMERLVAQL